MKNPLTRSIYVLALIGFAGLDVEVPPDAVPPDVMPESAEDMSVMDADVLVEDAAPIDPCDEPIPLDDDVLNGGPTLEAGCYVIDDSVRISEGILVLEPGVTIVFGRRESVRE